MIRPRIATRTATADDVPDLVRLNRAFNGGDEPLDALRGRMLDPARVEHPILAEIAGQGVGFAAVRIVPCIFYREAHAELTELYVEPDYRRLGVGSALIAHAERLARNGGAATLLVLTGFDNRPAQALYRRAGFVGHDMALEKMLAGS